QLYSKAHSTALQRLQLYRSSARILIVPATVSSPTIAAGAPESRSGVEPVPTWPMSRAVPGATYRLQFHQGFTFRDATALVPYLARLGTSHIYASPSMDARPGSRHGYDIIDHNGRNPEIGTEAEFAALVAALTAQGMGLTLAIGP